MPDTHTFDEHRDAILGAVRQVGDTFVDPEDDWIPVVWVLGGQPKIIALDIESKDAWPSFFRGPIREMKPTFVGLVISVWTADRESEEAVAAGPPPSEDPDRKEAVMVEVSDGRAFEIWSAPITRFPTVPPTLGEWKKMDMIEHSGRLAALTLQAFESGTQS